MRDERAEDETASTLFIIVIILACRRRVLLTLRYFCISVFLPTLKRLASVLETQWLIEDEILGHYNM